MKAGQRQAMEVFSPDGDRSGAGSREQGGSKKAGGVRISDANG